MASFFTCVISRESGARMLPTASALAVLAVGCKKQKQTKLDLDATQAQYNSEWLESWEANIGVWKIN